MAFSDKHLEVLLGSRRGTSYKWLNVDLKGHIPYLLGSDQV